MHWHGDLKAVRDEAGTGQHHIRCDQWYTATVSQSEYLSRGYLFGLLGAFLQDSYRDCSGDVHYRPPKSSFVVLISPVSYF